MVLIDKLGSALLMCGLGVILIIFGKAGLKKATLNYFELTRQDAELKITLNLMLGLILFPDRKPVVGSFLFWLAGWSLTLLGLISILFKFS